jgi:hypothetical protein
MEDLFDREAQAPHVKFIETNYANIHLANFPNNEIRIYHTPPRHQRSR